MDDNVRALHIATLKIFDEKLSLEDRTSISERLLRPLLTAEEFSAYRQQKSELASTTIRRPSLPPLAEAYWKKCKQVIAASSRARNDQAQKNAAYAAEKCQEAFEELPDEDKFLFEELSSEEWGLQYPQVEYQFPVPKNRVPVKLYTGTAKNAAQRFAILSALKRLEAGANDAGESNVIMTRPPELRERGD